MDNKILSIVIQTAIVITVLLFVVIMLIKRFVYFRPSSHFMNTLEPYRVIRQRHIHSWILDGTNDQVILFCHGNAGNVSNRESKVKALNNYGYTVLIFDYSGYGHSEGVPTEQNCYDDASIMAAYLRQNYDPNNIIVYGESLGGPVATYVARRYMIPILILEGPLPSIKMLIKSRYPLLRYFTFLFPEFDTVKYLDGYTGRSLLIHSVQDEVIPYTSVQELINNVTMHIQMDGSHNFPNIPWDKIDSFIRSS